MLISIPSNITEGFGRTSEKEFLHFLRIVISSYYELETQLIVVKNIVEIETNELLLKGTENAEKINN